MLTAIRANLVSNLSVLCVHVKRDGRPNKVSIARQENDDDAKQMVGRTSEPQSSS